MEVFKTVVASIGALYGVAILWIIIDARGGWKVRRAWDKGIKARLEWERGVTARLAGHDAQITILERALVTEDPRGVKPTTALQRPTDRALADATAKRHPPMLPPSLTPPPSRSPEAVAALVSEARGETTGAPVETAGDRAGLNPGDAIPGPFAGKPRIKVRIEAGVFKGERSVSFVAGDRTFALFAHESTIDANEGTMLVTVVEGDGTEVDVDLPGEAIQGGRRVRIPRAMVLDYPPEGDATIADPPATPHATAPGDSKRRLSDRPPPPVVVETSPASGSVAPPSLPKLPRPADEEGEETRAFDADAAARALREATAEPEQPQSSAARTAAERPSGKRSPPVFRPRAVEPPGVLVRFEREDGSPLREPRKVPPHKPPRPDSAKGPTTRSPPSDTRPAPHREGWDLQCEMRATRLMQDAASAGEDVSHCVALGGECRGIMGCSCNCAPCSRRRGLEDQAYRDVKGPPLP